MAQGTRYCLVLFAVMLLLLGGVATFNALVDPYDRYRLVTLRGFNAYKSEASHGLRLYKSLACTPYRTRSDHTRLVTQQYCAAHQPSRMGCRDAAL